MLYAENYLEAAVVIETYLRGRPPTFEAAVWSEVSAWSKEMPKKKKKTYLIVKEFCHSEICRSLHKGHHRSLTAAGRSVQKNENAASSCSALSASDRVVVSNVGLEYGRRIPLFFLRKR